MPSMNDNRPPGLIGDTVPRWIALGLPAEVQMVNPYARINLDCGAAFDPHEQDKFPVDQAVQVVANGS